ncbi:hypothetical protein RDWZM_004661 [Blomia tropicalis]|uniref:CRAL-TRIO domain-containing protein n=1 Tax=Blomia tropicalis TaxID=40697 RepID=A0A9Q0M4Q4_BLOTA|nr:hypothetical protein RDWZM_004661 [Blomia tropicalis]
METSKQSSSTTKDEAELKLSIENVRKQFLLEASKEPDLYYQCDIESVKSDQWWTERFIKWNQRNETNALKQMLNTFRWRKSFGIHDRTAIDIPREFVKAAGIFPYGNDHKNRPILYIRVKVYQNIQQLKEFFQQFVAGIVNHVDQLGGRNGFVVVYDASEAGWRNLDYEFIQFLLQLFQHYYPYGLRYIIFYKFSKILQPFWKLSRLVLGSASRTFHFCNTAEELAAFIPKQYILRYMGGESDFDFTDYVEVRNAPSVRELAVRYGFTVEEVNKFIAIFEEQFRETDRIRNIKKK